MILIAFPCRAETLPESPAGDAELLNRIERDSIQYFVRMSDKKTGLTRDSTQPGSPASVAATGFSLAAFAVGQSQGWIDPHYAQNYIRKTLRALLRDVHHKNGFFYHFVDMRTGARLWNSEASSIDTALLVSGMFLAVQYYPHDAEMRETAEKIYRRINWKWMMNGSDFLSMGWKPESGFLPYYWDSYSEHLILQALAIGASENPIPPKAWSRWARHEAGFRDKKIVHSATGSLFTYQYAQAYIDFRDLEDSGINYFENSKTAAELNRDYSASFAHQFAGYRGNAWGLSASLGPGGYKAYGAKPGDGLHDGTIAPYAAISSVVFTPSLSAKAARHFYEKYGEKIYGRYGFTDAFNVDKDWWAKEYLGIDQGITVLMLENYLRDGIIWKKFMALPAVQTWIALTGIGKTKKEAVPATPAS